MYNYEHCKTALDSLIQYQSNVRKIIIDTTDTTLMRKKLFDNDQEFLDYISGRLTNVESAADPEVS